MTLAENGRTTKGERTQRAILDSARRVIMEQGYTAASMRTIAAGAGITPAAIYNHYDGKEALFSAVLEDSAPLAELAAFLNNVQGQSAQDLLAKAVDGLLGIVTEHEEYVRLALIDAQERDGATLASFFPRVFPLMLGFVQRLQQLDGDEGRLRDLPAPLIVRSIVMMIGGYIITGRILRLQPPGVVPALDWQRGLLQVLMFGLFKEQQGVVDEPPK